MSIASQVACVLQDACPGLSAEATAVALGLDLRPLLGGRYRYIRASKRVEYDALAQPAEQDECIQRAIVCCVLDALELRCPKDTTITAIAREVFALRLGSMRSSA